MLNNKIPTPTITIYLIFILLGFMPVTVVQAESLYAQAIAQVQLSPELRHKTEQQLQESQTVENISVDLPRFHQQVSPAQKTEHFCGLCHDDLPHGENLQVRSFLNMHTAYISCETCHFRPEAYTLEQQWVDVKSGDLLNQTQAQFPSKTGIIRPFYQQQAVSLKTDHALFKKIADHWQQMPIAEQAPLKARIHTPLEEKGLACRSCHDSEQKILNLKQLGASVDQQQAITHNSIARFLAQNEDNKQPTPLIRLIDLLN
ncbi:hypothetical protein [Candidatus Venteria ishoeyi]|uniref:hypothetical protein n=1 Tax=Candidatus Venteria ishoeyi TaxID=1899563 RepID=UPI0015AC280E|nr:hypothetical protein [Candidatus Venteria ishoeyi]